MQATRYTVRILATGSHWVSCIESTEIEAAATRFGYRSLFSVHGG